MAGDLLVPHPGQRQRGRPANRLDRDSSSDRVRFGAEVRRLRHASGLNLEELAIASGRSPSHISQVENGEKLPSLVVVERWTQILKTDESLVGLYWAAKAEQTVERHELQERRRAISDDVGDDPSLVESARTSEIQTAALLHGGRCPSDLEGERPDIKGEDLKRRAVLAAFGLIGIDLVSVPLRRLADGGSSYVELLRQELDEALGEDTMAEASLDDWERTVFRLGRDTRDHPPAVLLGDLGVDLAELKRVLGRNRSPRLTRAVAQMSGLMCLTLVKLDERLAFRRWARTARRAARQAGDLVTHSWVLAQEAYGHYYSGDLTEAIEVAQGAQAIASSTPCVGVPLAAALEARAQAVLGRRREMQAALQRAEDVMSKLDGDSLATSAFGYNEAQLRFHEGNAYTHLRDTRSALRAQERALELCAPGDYTDWAMTRLDRASCLAYDGDLSAAVSHAIETITSLTEQQRQGIIARRGYALWSVSCEAAMDLPVKVRPG